MQPLLGQFPGDRKILVNFNQQPLGWLMVKKKNYFLTRNCMAEPSLTVFFVIFDIQPSPIGIKILLLISSESSTAVNRPNTVKKIWDSLMSIIFPTSRSPIFGEKKTPFISRFRYSLGISSFICPCCSLVRIFFSFSKQPFISGTHLNRSFSQFARVDFFMSRRAIGS